MNELDKSAVSWILVLTKTDKMNVEELYKIKDESNKVISKHPAAYPEIIMTSSLKNNGIEILRTYLASFA